MMGFLFGLMVGSAMSTGGAAPAQSALSQIPIRCLSLVDSEANYIECRFPSISKELADAALPECDKASSGSQYRACKSEFVTKNIKWEIASLKELSAAASKNSAAR